MEPRDKITAMAAARSYRYACDGKRQDLEDLWSMIETGAATSDGSHSSEKPHQHRS